MQTMCCKCLHFLAPEKPYTAQLSSHSGRKRANQAVAAARMQADVGFIACVGDDSFGINIRESFKLDGINTAGVKLQPNCPTGIAMIQVSDSGENSICISAEANAKLTAAAIEPDLAAIRDARYLLMQLETPLDGILKAAQEAKTAKTNVILNPAPAVNCLMSC